MIVDENDSGELESAERSAIATVKTKRAVVKRRITNTLKRLQGAIEQYGRKSIIRRYVNILEVMLHYYPYRPNHSLEPCTMYIQLRLHHHQCL